MKNFQLKIVVYDGNEDIDSRLPISEIDEVIEKVTVIEAGKTMIRRIRSIKDENPGRPFKLEAWLADEEGNLISVYAED